jgi:hypothetical protein
VSKWTTVILAVLLLAGLVVAMFVATPAETPTAVPKALVEFSPGDVLRLAVRNPRGEVLLERDAKDRERWRVRSGTTAVRADSAVIEDLLLELSRMAPRNVYAESEIGSGDRAAWGLEAPAVRLTLGLEGREASVEFGGRAQGQRNAWAQKPGSPEVYLVPADALERLQELAVEGVRERRPLGWSPYETRSLALRRQDGLEIEAERSSAGTWEVTKPFRGPAEPTAMEGVLAKVLGLEAKEFAADGAPDPERFGLREPLAVITLRREGRESAVTVRVSKPAGDGKAFFEEVGEPSVYAGGADLAKAVAALDPAKLRDPNLLRLGWSKLDSVEFVRPEGGWKLLRILEEWHLEKPERVPAEAEAVQTLLKALRETQATRFLDGEDPAPRGLATAEGAATRLEIKGTDEAGSRTLLVGKRTEDGGVEVRLLPAAGAKDEPPVVVVPASFLDLLESDWLHWRTREVLEIPLAEVRGLSRRIGGVEQSFLRENNAWKAAPGGPEPDGEALTAALTQLLHLECSSFHAKTKEGLEAYGLGDPPEGAAITVTLRREGETESRTRTLILGRKPEGEAVRFARMADGDLVFRLADFHVQGANLVRLYEVLVETSWAKGEGKAPDDPPPPPAPAPAPPDAPEDPPPAPEGPK